MHHHHSCCCGGEPGGPCCSSQQLFGATPQYAGTDADLLRTRLTSSRAHSGTVHIRATPGSGNCYEIGPFSYEAADTVVNTGPQRCRTNASFTTPTLSTPFTTTLCTSVDNGPINHSLWNHSASSIYNIAAISLFSDVFTLDIRGGNPDGSGLNVLWRMRANGTTTLRLSQGADSNQGLVWNEVFEQGGSFPETRTVDAVAQVELITLPGGFVRGVRISAQWQTTKTVNHGPRPGRTTSTSGAIFAESLIENLVLCGAGAGALFVPDSVPPPDPSMLVENRIIPPTDPAIQDLLDQQSRGGGCRGCGDGNNF
jgi:hypothetical protein